MVLLCKGQSSPPLSTILKTLESIWFELSLCFNFSESKSYEPNVETVRRGNQLKEGGPRSGCLIGFLCQEEEMWEKRGFSPGGKEDSTKITLSYTGYAQCALCYA